MMINKTKENTKEIPYDEMDQEIVELVKKFNEIGLETEFSCYGHSDNEETYVTFEQNVSDESIYELAKFLSKKEIKTWSDHVGFFGFGEFNKWVRDNEGALFINWTYSFPHPMFGEDPKKKENFKNIFMENILHALDEYIAEL